MWKLKATRGLWAVEVGVGVGVEAPESESDKQRQQQLELEWIRCDDDDNRPKCFQVQIKGKDRTVHIGRARSTSNDDTADTLLHGAVAQARCEAAMCLLDAEHRAFVAAYKFDEEILAIKAVAGSGKTTTLLNLCTRNPDKRVLYIAFNKALIEDIKEKAAQRGIRNVTPMTFDALVYKEAASRQQQQQKQKQQEEKQERQQRQLISIDEEMMMLMMESSSSKTLEIVDLKPHSLGRALPWLEDKPWAVKDHYVRAFNAFCKQPRYLEPGAMMPGKPLLETMWKETRAGRLNTFAGLRKLAQVDHWFKDRLSKDYDCVFIDEAQDFDPIMLEILLLDVNIPKIFVGDPMQEIYGWRGCINAFARLPPSTTLCVEFYTTFRMGNPACRDVCALLGNSCRMIPGGDQTRETHLYTPVWGEKMRRPEPGTRFVWLFRTWRCLLEEAARWSAENSKDIWINGFAAQMNVMRALHKKLSKNPSRNLSKAEEDEFSDDLPRYLLSLSHADLENLIAKIENNMADDPDDASVHMYTIHAYKGLEDDVVVVYNDIDPAKDDKLLYVAVTRGRREVYLEPRKLPSVVAKRDASRKMVSQYF